MLCERLDNNSFQTNVDSVRHVCIHKTNTIGPFTNAYVLTLCLQNVMYFCDSIATNFNCIIFLRQLTKVTIERSSLSFEQVIELFILKFDPMLFHRTDSVSISFSYKNSVTILSIDKEYYTG
jgi:hypothetical protein